MQGTGGTGLAKSDGFALIEALASLVIVGMLALMMIQGVTTGQRVWDRLDRRAASVEAVDGAQTVLRSRIEQLFPATLYGNVTAMIDMQGGPESLGFVATPAEALRPSTLRRYSLDLTTNQDLVLSSVGDVAVSGGGGVNRQVLLTGVRELNIAYFGASATDPARRWRPTWTSEIMPPELVRVRVEFEPGDPRFWPDLIVRPRADIDTGCILSGSTNHCRGRQ